MKDVEQLKQWSFVLLVFTSKSLLKINMITFMLNYKDKLSQLTQLNGISFIRKYVLH